MQKWEKGQWEALASALATVAEIHWCDFHRGLRTHYSCGVAVVSCLPARRTVLGVHLYQL